MNRSEVQDHEAAVNAAILQRLVADVEGERYRLQRLELRVVGHPDRRGHPGHRSQQAESRLDQLDRCIGGGDLCAGRIIRLTFLMREFGTSHPMPPVTAALFRQLPQLERFASVAEAILEPTTRRPPLAH